MPDLIPAGSGPWRYRQIARTDATDYSSPSYVDSGWSTGSGPFENTGGATVWALDTRLWIRRWFTLIRTEPVRFEATIDNDVVLYLDGAQIGAYNNPQGLPGWLLSVELDVGPGSHLVAARGTDDPPQAIDHSRLDVRVRSLVGGFLVGAVAT